MTACQNNKLESSSRSIVKIIKELASSFSIEYKSFEKDWVILLSYKDRRTCIVGYYFSVNNASGLEICNHKPYTFQILNGFGVPCVEHIGLEVECGPLKKTWVFVENYSQLWKNVVCKSSNGSGGMDIYLTANVVELKNIVSLFFNAQRSCCISPYYESDAEYRVIIFEGEPLLIYRKERPHIIGDGQTKISDLIEYYVSNSDRFEKIRIKKTFERSCKDLSNVLQKKNVYFLSWQYNLSLGGTVHLDVTNEIKEQLINIAIKAAQSMGIAFCSVDVLSTPQGLKVLEINPGVVMEYFISQMGKEGYEIAKSIYSRAILRSLGLDKELDISEI